MKKEMDELDICCTIRDRLVPSLFFPNRKRALAALFLYGE